MIKFSIKTVDKFKILKIEEPFMVLENLQELQDIIWGLIAQRHRHILVNFSEIAYIYSGAIRVLIQIFKVLKDLDGELGILEPKLKVFNILREMGLHKIIRIYHNEAQFINRLSKISNPDQSK